MGRVLEHDAKQVIAGQVRTPAGQVASSAAGAEAIAAELGADVVVKALVPAGKRGKAGAIKFAATPAEAGLAAAELLGATFGGYPVRQVLVEQRLQIEREYYLSLTIDRDARQTRLLLSATGGVDIEELTREQPESLISWPVSLAEGLPEFRARALWQQAGIRGSRLTQLGRITAQLYRRFTQLDAYLLEINPLVETVDGEIAAAGAVLAIDDAAMFRQPELVGIVQVGSEKVWRPLTELEERVNAINAAEPYRGSARYLELEGGDIGFLCGGGGASLVLFDYLLQAGGQPANYAEVGGNPTESKVAGLARVVLAKPGVRGLFIAHNISNNTQIDVIARGVVQAMQGAGLTAGDFPVVAREIGVHDSIGREIFEQAGIHYLGENSTLSDAAYEMVRLMKKRYGGTGVGLAG